MPTKEFHKNNMSHNHSPALPPDDPGEYHIDEADPPVLIYYIFEKPATAPMYWVTVPTLVRGEQQEAIGEATKARSLEDARNNVPNRARCKCFPRNPDDPPELIEAWIEVDGSGD